jgi:two-component system, chemotaxis family, protein-glutamate methylesterase/glutaminase
MPYRLLIADTSPIYRLRLSQALSNSNRLQVVGLTGTGQETIDLIKEGKVDVLILDLDISNPDGLSVLNWVMSNHPLPTIIYSQFTNRETTLGALETGAVDFVIKPDLKQIVHSEDFIRLLRLKVEVAAENYYRVISRANETVREEELIQMINTSSQWKGGHVVGIVGSTGSPAAIKQITSKLKPDFPSPIIVALHMPSGFTRSLADRLARDSSLPIREAQNGDIISKAEIFIAPGGKHTAVVQDQPGTLRFNITPAEPTDLYTPSADHLLKSLATACGASSIGIVLTGMGNDGVQGARAIRACKGRVFVESKKTALIWGMPRAIIEAGLADGEIDLHQIPVRLPFFCEER